MDKRKQINARVSDDVLEALDDIRAMLRPIPSMSEMLRIAILNERDRLRRKTDAQKKGAC